MEDAIISEPIRITADSQAALRQSLADALLERSRGAFWLADIDEGGYTIDLHHAYYIREPSRVRCVHDHYARLLRIPIQTRKPC